MAFLYYSTFSKFFVNKIDDTNLWINILRTQPKFSEELLGNPNDLHLKQIIKKKILNILNISAKIRNDDKDVFKFKFNNN